MLKGGQSLNDVWVPAPGAIGSFAWNMGGGVQGGGGGWCVCQLPRSDMHALQDSQAQPPHSTDKVEDEVGEGFNERTLAGLHSDPNWRSALEIIINQVPSVSPAKRRGLADPTAVVFRLQEIGPFMEGEGEEK